MKGRPAYSVFSCLFGNRIAKWLMGVVVMATAVVFLNGYMVYNTQHQSGTEMEQSVTTTHSTREEESRPPTLWVYHDTVCQLERFWVRGTKVIMCYYRTALCIM